MTPEQRDKKRAADRAYYQANKEKIKAKVAAWAKANPERKAAADKAWREENGERKALTDRQWRLSNPERKRASNAEWAAANPLKVKFSNQKYRQENREEINAHCRDRYQENISEERRRSRVYRETFPEKRAATCRAWQAANPEKVLAGTHRRIARKHNAASPFVVVTNEIQAERKALTNGCAFCGAQEKLELEHVVALNDGGLHVPSNLIGSCKKCNCSKGSSPVYEWYSKQPFFSEQRWQRIQEITGQGQLSLI
jgi:5-methylcytosine-specific restriction endonuclease McrA